MSGREEILEALETALKTITTANGYGNNVATVSRHFRHYSELNSFPALMIIPGPGEVKVLDGLRQIEREEFLIGIRGYVKAGRDTTWSGKLSTALESLIADIRACVAKNRDLGISFVYYLEVKNIDPYFDWKQQIGICDVVVNAAYKYLNQNP